MLTLFPFLPMEMTVSLAAWPLPLAPLPFAPPVALAAMAAFSSIRGSRSWFLGRIMN